MSALRGIFTTILLKKCPLSALERCQEILVTDKQVKFGRDQPSISILGRCPPYSGVRLERVEYNNNGRYSCSLLVAPSCCMICQHPSVHKQRCKHCNLQKQPEEHQFPSLQTPTSAKKKYNVHILIFKIQ